ncbi:hypothetical protein HBB16_04270 [Pseudonocardia sp. MCCB 268]|nr:hypothetical protein [Pseudonocardia cytotoxica]
MTLVDLLIDDGHSLLTLPHEQRRAPLRDLSLLAGPSSRVPPSGPERPAHPARRGGRARQRRPRRQAAQLRPAADRAWIKHPIGTRSTP